MKKKEKNTDIKSKIWFIVKAVIALIKILFRDRNSSLLHCPLAWPSQQHRPEVPSRFFISEQNFYFDTVPW